ncbi:BamA/TamA family outer membrane protein [Marivirga lumbricoides]
MSRKIKEMLRLMSESLSKNIAIIIVLSIISYSCNTLKRLPENELLYTGAETSVEGEAPRKYKKQVEDKIEGLAIPKPNSKILGMRLGLWAYQKVERGEAGFYAKWVNKRIGEEPVLMSDVEPEQVEKLYYNRLENLGFFYGEVESDTIHKKETGSATYVVRPGDRLMISDYTYRSYGDTTLDSLITAHVKEQKIILPDQPYTLEKLTTEREAIATYLKENGYYYFVEKYLLYTADSIETAQDNYASLTLSVKQSTPEDALLRYKIGDITVYPKYSIKLDSGSSKTDSTVYKDVTFIQEDTFFKPYRMYPYLLINEGDFYAQENEEFTLRRLNSLETYRFVNIRYEEDSVKENGIGFLNTSLYLSPTNKRAFRAELQGVSQSNNFAGPTFNVEYENRNLFRGGEIFTVRGKVGYQAQLSGRETSGLSNFETGIGGELTFPRLIAPGKLESRFRYSVPRTKANLSYDLLRRVKLFTLHSFLAELGYQWKGNAYVTHTINPISINVINLSKSTAEFDSILSNNQLLQSSFDQQFIAGLNYSFEYNKLIRAEKVSRFYVLFNADFAGNTISLVKKIGGESGPEQEFLGQQYAQYSKLDVDVRHYLNIGEESHFVSRIFAGFGFPYGNSESLPYSKQYFSGGPNSVRAFRIRSLGPGSFVPEESGSRGAFFDQAGDIKLEANLEYRFPLVSVLKGAVFTDAGNVWLKNGGPTKEFSKNWIDQVAVGAGIGLRVDIEFFVIRLDVATPLRKVDGNGNFFWQDNFNLGSKSWRQDNVIWNFGIGYPF